jgi:arabinose-5-phosphate isomerase
MGKSGLIAKKISATLSSTGTSSYFVHPGEASHGDLGIISRDDMVLLLSNSGETSELKDIINYTKRFNIKLACMVRNGKSSLAEEADIKIVIPASPEALDFEAPTTSTTMMLVLGDALALTLLEKKGFTREDFRIFHPGGRLGASFVKVKNIMHIGNKVPLIYENSGVPEIISVMTEKGFGCVAVLDKKDFLTGIITDGNLRRHICPEMMELFAKDIMTKSPITIKPDSLSVEALDLMNRKAITNLIVTEQNSHKVSGILHIHDCLRTGASPYFTK